MSYDVTALMMGLGAHDFCGGFNMIPTVFSFALFRVRIGSVGLAISNVCGHRAQGWISSIGVTIVGFLDTWYMKFQGWSRDVYFETWYPISPMEKYPTRVLFQ
ncbi:hypothetical protein BS50DRAFT_74115 [Corynespora cassiicola Philippines]|uniref:Uncharacterized protein n=1 Tax=Corynespora cassiicola Philippines TaxID=1448308 RepID=A0A2T2NGQ8_CORCC|nr:hypothetical protein BS50DRAFT_74115 [Corynespora cassiicola Philippines]